MNLTDENMILISVFSVVLGSSIMTCCLVLINFIMTEKF